MNVELDQNDQKRLEALARTEGKDATEILRELVHEGLESRTKNGSTSSPSAKEAPPGLSLSGLAGLGKDLWEGEDAQEYVRRLRRGWE